VSLPRRHPEPGSARGENPWAGQGAVVLDIGGDIGALVVEAPAWMTGVEVEIRPEGEGAAPAGHHRPHVAVVARPAGGRTVPSLVFPALSSGTYELCVKGSERAVLTARVEGGRVTRAAWPRLTPEDGAAAPSEAPAWDA
jgi:hypothetical protein